MTLSFGERAFARSPIATALQRAPLRAVALLGLVALAYHYSLSTLVRGLSLQTPLAYLGLVPAIALVLAWVRLGREPAPRAIHDRQLDYIVGFGFVASALGLLVLLPATLDTRFWLYRIDLLSLPLFVAGIVAMLWGVRRLWAVKVPVLFLLLAWPLPYLPLVSDWTDAFTGATAAVLAFLSSFVPLAQPAPGDGLVFYIGEGPRAFAVSVGSACAGVNSVVGFVLIGTALAYVVRGPAVRRAAWLAAGLTIVWLLNIGRIEAIFAVGALLGRQAALDVLHPGAGLIMFNLGVIGMLAVVPWFGLRFASFPTVTAAAVLRTPSPVRRGSVALVTAGCLAVALGVVNTGLGRYEEIATPLGEARRLEPFDIREAQVPGWTSGFMARNDGARQFFGERATWDRLQYVPGQGATLSTSVPLYVDVIGTDDPGALAAYGVEDCYAFHGYQIESVASIDIGAGIDAQVIDYHNRKIGADWSAIWWEWPYQKNGRTWYERIVVFIASGPSARYAGTPPILLTSQSERFAGTDRFLAAVAREMVQSQLLVRS